MVTLKIKRLEWDIHNVEHIALHDVTTSEVEEVRKDDVARKDSRNNYIVIVGKTKAGRTLKIVLEPKGNDIWRPATAHDASRKERQWYQEEIGGEKAA